MRCRRVGQSYPDYVQPLLVTLDSREDVSWIVANARRLRDSNDNETRVNVFINPNLSFAERSAAYRARCRRRGDIPNEARSSTVRAAAVPAVPSAGSAAEWPRLASSVPVITGRDGDGSGDRGGDRYGAGTNQLEGRPIRVVVNERFKHHSSRSLSGGKGLGSVYERSAAAALDNPVSIPEMLTGEFTKYGLEPRAGLRAVPVTQTVCMDSQMIDPTTAAVTVTAVTTPVATTAATTAATESLNRLSTGTFSPAASGVLGDGDLMGAISVSTSATLMPGSKDPDRSAEERRP